MTRSAGDDMIGGDFDEMPITGTAHVAPPARGQKAPLSKKLIPIVFISIVVAMVTISFILSIVTSVGGSVLNLLLGTALIGLLVVQVIMVILARTGGIPRQKTWFVYLVGLCIVVESVLTNVVMFNAT